MDIDVERTEFQVLMSINWQRVDIKYILLEQREMSLIGVLESQEYRFLSLLGYEAIGKFDRTVIYKKQN